MFEVEAAFRFFGALAFVVGLIVLLSYAARRHRGLASGKLGRPRRLSIVEAVGVDAKRRLVLAQVQDVGLHGATLKVTAGQAMHSQLSNSFNHYVAIYF